MKKRALCWLLVLVMVASLLPTFSLPAAAADENGTITNPAPATDESGNLHLTKTLAPGANGTYDITMESWATGEVKTQGITEKIPTDFVLVVDQSGSMDTKDMPTGTPTVQNNKYLEDIANGAYYYKDGEPVKEKWELHKGKWYFLGEDGKMYKHKWLKWKGDWYYLKSDGAMSVSEWQKASNGEWCYLGKDGKMLSDTWVSWKGAYYFVKKDGYMARGNLNIIETFDGSGKWVGGRQA